MSHSTLTQRESRVLSELTLGVIWGVVAVVVAVAVVARRPSRAIARRRSSRPQPPSFCSGFALIEVKCFLFCFFLLFRGSFKSMD